MEKKLKHKEVLDLIKRNEAQDFLKVLTEYAVKNTENLVIGAVIVLVIAVGIPLFLNSRAANEVKAEQILSKADYFLTRPVSDQKNAQMYGMFRTKDEKFEKGIAAYQEVVQTYKSTKSLPYAYLGIADAYFNDGKYKESLEYYNTFLEKFQAHYLAPQALSGRAYAYCELGRYKEALDDLNTAMQKYKDSYLYNDIRLKAAECYLKLKNPADAKQLYTQIIGDGRNSYWASVAEVKLREIK
jgi:tetratricopeptide (TPR) repeat protein